MYVICTSLRALRTTLGVLDLSMGMRRCVSAGRVRGRADALRLPGRAANLLRLEFGRIVCEALNRSELSLRGQKITQHHDNSRTNSSMQKLVDDVRPVTHAEANAGVVL